MNVSKSSLTLPQSTSSIGQAQRPPKGGGRPPGADKPSHSQAIETLGSELSEEIQEAMLESVEQLQEEGASFEDIKAFVDSELEANGVDVQRPGQLLNVRL